MFKFFKGKNNVESIDSKQEKIKIEYISYDLSFIPQTRMSKELKEFDGTKIVYPYTKNDNVNLELLKAQDNYFNLDQLLRELADNEYKKGNISLSKEVYELLLSLGTKIASNKENLLKIYLSENNTDGIELIRSNLFKQLEDEKDYNYQKNKVQRIIEKYSL